MHYLRRIFVSLILFSFSAELVFSQTAIVAPPAVIRKQDREACAAQAAQQGITKRNLVTEYVRKCMVERMTARKTAERKELLEQWKAERKELEKKATKEAACKKQAREQKLHLKKRSRFIKDCMAK